MLIETSRMTIEQVAAQVGYEDATALRRLMGGRGCHAEQVSFGVACGRSCRSNREPACQGPHGRCRVSFPLRRSRTRTEPSSLTVSSSLASSEKVV
jgi:hypothetical protein